MLIIAFGATAAAILVPFPADAFGPRDYPKWALAKNISAASTNRLTISPAGRIEECTNLHIEGDPVLANDVCRMLTRKKLPSPTLRDGRKVYAFVESHIWFTLPETAEGRRIESLRPAPDAEISVQAIPAGLSPDIAIHLAFDADGKVTDCAPATSEADLALTDIACGQRALFDNVIRKDPAGQPVAYVTRKRIRFVVAGAE